MVVNHLIILIAVVLAIFIGLILFKKNTKKKHKEEQVAVGLQIWDEGGTLRFDSNNTYKPLKSYGKFYMGDVNQRDISVVADSLIISPEHYSVTKLSTNRFRVVRIRRASVPFYGDLGYLAFDNFNVGTEGIRVWDSNGALSFSFSARSLNYSVGSTVRWMSIPHAEGVFIDLNSSTTLGARVATLTPNSGNGNVGLFTSDGTTTSMLSLNSGYMNYLGNFFLNGTNSFKIPNYSPSKRYLAFMYAGPAIFFDGYFTTVFYGFPLLNKTTGVVTGHLVIEGDKTSSPSFANGQSADMGIFELS